MTAMVLSEWLGKQNTKIQCQHRMVLILYNTARHSKIELSNTELVFPSHLPIQQVLGKLGLQNY